MSPEDAESWKNRDPDTGRHIRNGHVLVLGENSWICLGCRHKFDAASDANLFHCGEKCVHPGDEKK